MQNGLHLSYESGEPSLDPRLKEVEPRETFYHLVNIDEHPEVLPLARALALEELGGVGDGGRTGNLNPRRYARGPGSQLGRGQNRKGLRPRQSVALVQGYAAKDRSAPARYLWAAE